MKPSNWYPTAVIQSAAAALAALPGVAVLLTGLGVPEEMKVLFGALYTTVGTLTILVLGILRNSIGRASAKRTVITCALLSAVGLAAFFNYQRLYRKAVVSSTEFASEGRVIEREFYFPLRPPGRLRSWLLEADGSYFDVIETKTPELVAEELQEPYLALARAWTDLFLLVNLLGLAGAFTAALSMAGWRLSLEVDELGGSAVSQPG